MGGAELVSLATICGDVVEAPGRAVNPAEQYRGVTVGAVPLGVALRVTNASKLDKSVRNRFTVVLIARYRCQASGFQLKARAPRGPARAHIALDVARRSLKQWTPGKNITYFRGLDILPRRKAVRPSPHAPHRSRAG